MRMGLLNSHIKTEHGSITTPVNQDVIFVITQQENEALNRVLEYFLEDENTENDPDRVVAEKLLNGWVD